MKDCMECHRPCYPDEYKCPACGDVMCSKECLRDHIEEHTEDELVDCTCDAGERPWNFCLAHPDGAV